MSFGFSVGDFIAAASLISNIVSCLRSSGGSASEYQELTDELHGLRLVLSKISHLESSVQQTEEMESVKIAARSCIPLLENFRQIVEPYSKSLERGKTRGWVVDAKRKVQWELTMKTEVQKFRMCLNTRIDTLNLSLSIAGL
jgi:hypothetical protein